MDQKQLSEKYEWIATKIAEDERAYGGENDQVRRELHIEKIGRGLDLARLKEQLAERDQQLAERNRQLVEARAAACTWRARATDLRDQLARAKRGTGAVLLGMTFLGLAAAGRQ